MNHPRFPDGRSVAEQNRINEAAADSVRCCTLCRSPDLALVGVYIPGRLVQAMLRPEGGRDIGMAYGLCPRCEAVPGVLDVIARTLELPVNLATYMAWQAPPPPDRGTDEPHARRRPRLSRPAAPRAAPRWKAPRRS